MNRLRVWQDALGAIVTSADPAAALAAQAGTMVGRLDAAAVARYAQGLVEKSWGEVAACLPLSCQYIGSLGWRYQAWLTAHPPRSDDTVLSPGAAQALRALPALAAALADDPGEAPWGAELLVFETQQAASRDDGRPRTLTARYPLHTIIADLRAGLVPIDPPQRPHAYVFDGGGVRVRYLP
jgi:hypothetical protein